MLTPEAALPDGSFLAAVSPSPKARRPRTDGGRVRVIEYTLDAPARPGHGETDRLIPSLLDPPRYPAAVLAAEYHQRWERELTGAAVKTYQADRRPAPPIRSRKPREVVPEVYGLRRAHLAGRLTMDEAATAAPRDPDQLSCTGTLRVLRRAIPRVRRGVVHPAGLPLLSSAC